MDGLYTQFGGFVEHETIGSGILVADDAVEDSVLDGILDIAHGARRREAEGLHDFLAIDGRLEVAHTVLLLDVHQFAFYQVEILAEALHLVLVLARDVGLAQRHQVVDIVARVKEQPPHGAVGHLVLDQGDGTHVQAHEFFHIFHVLVERQAHLGKNLGHHLLADEVVVVECPSQLRVPALGARLAHIMQQGSPPQPHVVAGVGDVVEHLQRVHEVVLVSAAIDGFHALEGCQLGEDERQQSALVQQHPAA